ncbi:hypothetical protein ABK040_010961 [Willaertia magna]
MSNNMPEDLAVIKLDNNKTPFESKVNEISNTNENNNNATTSSAQQQQEALTELVQQQKKDEYPDLKERIKASVILPAIGDAIGFKNGSFEFCFSGETMHKQVEKLGGLENISLKRWKVSDDTIMHMATLKSLLEVGDLYDKHLCNTSPITFENESFSFYLDSIMKIMAKEYIVCFSDMNGRCPGNTTGAGIQLLKKNKWDSMVYNIKGGGNSGSMRSMSIGLMFYNQLDLLIGISIESSRLTHTHVNGFMGSLLSSLFTSYAIQLIPPKLWGKKFIKQVLPRCKYYLKEIAKRHWEFIILDITHFEEKFMNYLRERNLWLDSDSNSGNEVNELESSEPVFPEVYGVKERDEFYKKWSYAGYAGASGDDSIIVAYDALLSAGPNNYEEVIKRGALHGGDSDTTGTIVMAWYGALYGFTNVVQLHLDDLEKLQDLTELSARLTGHVVKENVLV